MHKTTFLLCLISSALLFSQESQEQDHYYPAQQNQTQQTGSCPYPGGCANGKCSAPNGQCSAPNGQCCQKPGCPHCSHKNAAPLQQLAPYHRGVFPLPD